MSLSYDPHLGRFLSEDPIRDGSNWYAFAGNDPVNFADPTGLFAQGHPTRGNSPLDNVLRQAVNAPATNNWLGQAARSVGAYVGSAVGGAYNALPSAIGRGVNALAGALSGPAQRRPTMLPIAGDPVVRSIVPGNGIVPRSAADLPGVRGALDNPDRYAIANHSGQGYFVVDMEQGGVKYVTGDDYLSTGELSRRAFLEGQSAAGRAAFADFAGEALISISPLHETGRDLGIATFGRDFYNPNQYQSFDDRQTAATFLFVPGGNSGQLRYADEALQGLRGALPNTAPRQFWTQTTEFQGSKVYQRSDLIDPTVADKLGRTNLQRMQQGRAPIGPDGKPVHLHHMLQTQDGPLSEMTQTFHQQNSRIIHINPTTTPSGINRPAFDTWREQYWLNRATNFGGGAP